ncbi:MAG: DNA-directed RNA polymerase subunit B'', partial [Nitrososphaerota archaeon]|nr:DNA-directed RNA polymerase subunit B'' [Nitrososphaerota archaeon]
VAKQHLNSYNEFIKYGLQSIVDEVSTVEIETPINKYQIKLGRIEIDKPRVVEHDGSENYIYPREARLRDLTYAVPLRLQMQIIDPSNTTFRQSF